MLHGLDCIKFNDEGVKFSPGIMIFMEYNLCIIVKVNHGSWMFRLMFSLALFRRLYN